MGGFASSRILEVHGERMIKRTFNPGFRIELHQKDLNLALHGGARAGRQRCPTPRPPGAVQRLRRARRQGLGPLGDGPGAGDDGQLRDRGRVRRPDGHSTGDRAGSDAGRGGPEEAATQMVTGPTLTDVNDFRAGWSGPEPTARSARGGMEVPMRIKVINPNTTAGMTAKIGEAARARRRARDRDRRRQPGGRSGLDREPLRRGDERASACSRRSAKARPRASTATSSPASATRASSPPARSPAGRCSASPRPRCTRRASRHRLLGRDHAHPHLRHRRAPGRALRHDALCRKVRGTDIPCSSSRTRARDARRPSSRSAGARWPRTAAGRSCSAAPAWPTWPPPAARGRRAGDRRRRGRGEAGGGAGRPRARHQQARRSRLADAQALRRQPRLTWRRSRAACEAATGHLGRTV